MTPEQRIEYELSLSNTKREERAQRMRELAELEQQLFEQRKVELQSLSWTSQLRWSKLRPVVAAVLGAAASMTAAYYRQSDSTSCGVRGLRAMILFSLVHALYCALFVSVQVESHFYA
jgi:hypothetical protein